MTPGALRPWHREPLVWLVISFPLAAVLGGFWTLWLAFTTADGLVVDDYYRAGLAINQELKRDREARARGLEATVSLSAAGELSIVLSARDPADLPSQLKIQLIHATRAGFDRTFLLGQSKAPGAYQIALSPLEAGPWLIHLEAAGWRLVKSFTVKR